LTYCDRMRGTNRWRTTVIEIYRGKEARQTYRQTERVGKQMTGYRNELSYNHTAPTPILT